jgi:hypothetical protein
VTENSYFDIVFVTEFSPYCMNQTQDTLNSGNQSFFFVSSFVVLL